MLDLVWILAVMLDSECVHHTLSVSHYMNDLHCMRQVGR